MDEKQKLIERIRKHNESLDKMLDSVGDEYKDKIIPYDVFKPAYDNTKAFYKLFYIPKHVEYMPLEHIKEFLGIEKRKTEKEILDEREMI